MKLLYIYDFYPPHIGGAEILYSHIAEYFAQNHEVIVLTQKTKGTLSYERMNNVHVYRVWTPARVLFPFFAFFKAVRLSSGVDILQTSLYSSAILTWILSPFIHAKKILLTLEIIGDKWSTMLNMPKFLVYFNATAEWFAATRNFDVYVPISENTKQQLQGIGIANTKIQRIYCGIDESLFRPKEKSEDLLKTHSIPTKKHLFLYFGRSGKTKGVQVLLQAFFQLMQKGTDAHLLLLLSPHPHLEFEQVKVFIAEHHMENMVTMIPPVARDDLPSYLALADTVVVPSLSEGFGFSAAEACSMEIPIIVSHVDSLPEVVSGRVLFTPPGDVSALLDALGKALKNEFEIIQKKRFAWQTTYDEFSSLYHSLLS